MNEYIDITMGLIHVCSAVLLPSDDPRTSCFILPDLLKRLSDVFNWSGETKLFWPPQTSGRPLYKTWWIVGFVLMSPSSVITFIVQTASSSRSSLPYNILKVLLLTLVLYGKVSLTRRVYLLYENVTVD